MTGCLQNADMAGGGTAGTTGTGTAGTSGQARAEFMLTNAKVTSGGSGTAGTTGTGATGTAGAMSSNTKFKLTGGNQQELREYLNSQVEIRGTLQKESPSSGAAAGTGTGATGQKKMDDDVQTIRVTSVKQVAKTCSGAN